MPDVTMPFLTVTDSPVCTMGPQPPSNPKPTDLWFDTINGFFFIWYDDGNTQQWVVTNPGRGPVTGVPANAINYVGSTPPEKPQTNQFWWNTDLGQLFLWYDDGTSKQWVIANWAQQGPPGPAGESEGYNVKDFGAVGDGTTPDSVAINDAITQVSLLGGGVIWMPTGVYLLDDTIVLRSLVTLRGQGYERTVLRLANGANRDMVVTEGFGTFASLSDPGVPERFGIEQMTLDGNYLAEAWNSATNTVNNSAGYGLKIEGYGFLIDVEARNIPEVGLRIAGEGGVPTTDEAYGSVRFIGRVFGKEGMIITGPNDWVFEDVFLGLCGLLPRPAAETVFAVSGVYAGEPVAGIVLDGVNVEINGTVHVYACWSGPGIKTRGTVRLEGNHLVSESNNAQVDFSSGTYGAMGVMSLRNLALVHPDWTSGLPAYTSPDPRWDAFTCPTVGYQCANLKINRTITSPKHVSGTNGLVLGGSDNSFTMVHTVSTPTDPTDPDFGGRYRGSAAVISGVNHNVNITDRTPRGNGVVVSAARARVSLQSQDPIGYGIQVTGTANIIDAIVEGQAQEAGVGVGMRNAGGFNTWAFTSTNNAVPYESSLGVGRSSFRGQNNLTRTFVIASDVITITNFDSEIIVDTEGAAPTDDLVTINGGFVGQIINLRSSTGARDTLVKNTGNIRLTSNYLLTTVNERLQLMFDGTNWAELARGLSDAATVSTVADLAGLISRPPRVFTLDRGGGEWTFITGNQTANVSADPGQGLWVAPASAPTGTSGAWKRVFVGGKVLVPWFGAVGDGVADDTLPIQRSLNYLLSLGKRGLSYLPPGTYRTTATITIDGVSVMLKGEAGDLSTFIIADHSSGPVVHMRSRRNQLCNLNIGASAARTAGGGVANRGVLIEAPDTPSFIPNYIVCDNLYVEDQPSDGILTVGACWYNKYEHLTIRDNAGHGMRFDNGEISARVNKQNPGEVKIERCEIFDNLGHGIQIGDDNSASNRGFRFVLDNVDMYRNAEAAGVRKSAAQMWAFWDTSSIRNSAFNGLNKAETAVVTMGLTMVGRSSTVETNRFLDMSGSAIHVLSDVMGFTTRDVKVRNNYAIDTKGTNPPLDPAVLVDAGAENVDVDWENNGEIVSAKPNQNNVSSVRSFMVAKLADQIVNNSVTQVSDTDLKFALLPKQRAAFRFVVFCQGDAAADLRLQVLAPSGATLWYASSNGLRWNGSAVVSQNATISSGELSPFGTDGTNIQLFEVVGYVLTNGTAGNLQLRFAQAVAQPADTTIKANSYLRIDL